MITSIIVYLFGPDLHDFCMDLDFCCLHASPLPVYSSLMYKNAAMLRSNTIFCQLEISDRDVTATTAQLLLQLLQNGIDCNAATVASTTVTGIDCNTATGVDCNTATIASTMAWQYCNWYYTATVASTAACC